jgi:hypothetical protein
VFSVRNKLYFLILFIWISCLEMPSTLSLLCFVAVISETVVYALCITALKDVLLVLIAEKEIPKIGDSVMISKQSRTSLTK